MTCLVLYRRNRRTAYLLELRNLQPNMTNETPQRRAADDRSETVERASDTASSSAVQDVSIDHGGRPRRCVPATPESSGCRTRPPAGASRTSAGACGRSPAWSGRRPGRRPASRAGRRDSWRWWRKRAPVSRYVPRGGGREHVPPGPLASARSGTCRASASGSVTPEPALVSASKDRPDPFEVVRQRLAHGRRQHRAAVLPTLAVAHEDLVEAEIDVLHSEAQALRASACRCRTGARRRGAALLRGVREPPRTSSLVSTTGNRSGPSAPARRLRGPRRAGRGPPVKEQQRRERLALRRGRDVPLDRQVR